MQRKSVYERHLGSDIRSLEFSDDGKYLAVSQVDDIATVLRLEDRTIVGGCGLETLRDISFSRDVRSIISMNISGTLVCDLQDS
jgi:hypothetical protein